MTTLFEGTVSTLGRLWRGRATNGGVGAPVEDGLTMLRGFPVLPYRTPPEIAAEAI
jgi:hypothetical protein